MFCLGTARCKTMNLIRCMKIDFVSRLDAREEKEQSLQNCARVKTEDNVRERVKRK